MFPSIKFLSCLWQINPHFLAKSWGSPGCDSCLLGIAWVPPHPRLLVPLCHQIKLLTGPWENHILCCLEIFHVLYLNQVSSPSSPSPSPAWLSACVQDSAWPSAPPGRLSQPRFGLGTLCQSSTHTTLCMLSPMWSTSLEMDGVCEPVAAYRSWYIVMINSTDFRASELGPLLLSCCVTLDKLLSLSVPSLLMDKTGTTIVLTPWGCWDSR